jgi:hypothetical protein
MFEAFLHNVVDGAPKAEVRPASRPAVAAVRGNAAVAP